MPGAGVEPARLSAAAFKAAVSAFPPPGRAAPARRHAWCSVTVAGQRRPGVPRRPGRTRVDAVSSTAPTAPDADPEHGHSASPITVDRPTARATRLLAAVRRHRADLLVRLLFAVLAGWLTHGLWPDPGGRTLALNPEDQTLYEWFLAVDARVAARRLRPAHRPAQRPRRGQPDGQHHGHRARRPLRAGHPAARAHRSPSRCSPPATSPAPPSPGTCCSPDAARPPGRRRARRRALRLRPGHGLAVQQPPAHDRPVAGAGDRLAGGPAAAGRPTRGPDTRRAGRTRTTGPDRRRLFTSAAGLAGAVTAQVFIGEEVLFLTALTLLVMTIATPSRTGTWPAGRCPASPAGWRSPPGSPCWCWRYPLWFQFAGPQGVADGMFTPALLLRRPGQLVDALPAVGRRQRRVGPADHRPGRVQHVPRLAAAAGRRGLRDLGSGDAGWSSPASWRAW